MFASNPADAHPMRWAELVETPAALLRRYVHATGYDAGGIEVLRLKSIVVPPGTRDGAV